MIKICGIRDAETAVLSIEAGATAIGLVFADSPRRVTAEEAARIVAELPPGVERIGVFRQADLRQLAQILDLVKLDAVQVHRAESLPEQLQGCEVIPGVRVEFVGEYDHDRVLVDSPFGEGSGIAWDFNDARGLARTRRMILAGGLSPENVTKAIERVHPYGVDVSSGVESAPGIKDHGRIREFVSAAREAMDRAGASS